MAETSTGNERKLLLKILYTGRDYVTDILALEKEIEDKDQEIAAHGCRAEQKIILPKFRE